LYQIYRLRIKVNCSSLRAAFVLITLVACAAAWLGAQISRCHQEEDAIARLSATPDGRSIDVLFASPFASPKKDVSGEPGTPGAFFQGGPKWLSRVLGADIFRARVKFGCAPPGNTFTWDVDENGRRQYKYTFKPGLTDADMASLNRLHYLRLLRLEANGITDDGLLQLDNLPYVEHLSLSHTAITDKGLSALANFPRLRGLDLRATDISDVAVSELGKCHLLENLGMEMTNISADGIKSLQQKLPKCKIEN